MDSSHRGGNYVKAEFALMLGDAFCGGRLQPRQATAADDNGGATTMVHNNDGGDAMMETVGVVMGEGSQRHGGPEDRI